MQKKITTEDTKLIQNANSLIVKFENVYEGFCFDEYAKKRIGEPIKEKRRCRFCHESMPNVTFKDVAHTIPEALGNKYIKTNDECDKCNHHFGATIEKDLLTMFDASRIFFCVRGKDGVPSKVKGDNYEIENDANNELHIRYYSHKDSQKLLFLQSKKIQPLNVYKALCKLAMGVLNEDVLKSLEKTRKWLMGEVVEKDLPKVALIYRSKILQSEIICTCAA